MVYTSSGPVDLIIDATLGCPSNWDILASNFKHSHLILLGPDKDQLWLVWETMQKMFRR